MENQTERSEISAPFQGQAGRPGRIFLVGFMGCGKTHWGRQLGPALGVPFIDLDEKIEESAGKPINAIFAEEGE
ncbi:MAG: transcriptional regulator, partial [Chitinophagaceae bacterium]